jgi:hypothetical protein
MFEATIWILLMQVAATLAMVGLIWFVQVVHYPLFARVGRSEFQDYEIAHQRLTTWVAAPLMLTEVSTAVALVWFRPTGVSGWLVWTGVALAAGIWLMTYWVQVPQHAKLAVAYDVRLQRSLVAGNWYRTIAWSGRGLLVLAMLAQTLTDKFTS